MNFIGSKTIETKRLILNPSRMEEQKRLWEILMIPKVNKFYLTSGKKHAHEPEYWTWESQKVFYESKVKKALEKDVFGWSIFIKKEYSKSGNLEVIGQVTAQENGIDQSIRDVGWYIDPDYQKMGYATEAARAMIDYMFNEVGINKIDSGCVKDNIGSSKIFEKLGFVKTGEKIEESPYTFYDGLLIFSKYTLDKELYFKKGNELTKKR